VVGVRRCIVFLEVAYAALGRGPCVDSVNVARSAWSLNMRARQREVRLAVVECRRAPRRGRMTRLAVRREGRGCMLRICCRVVLLLMTAHALCGDRLVLIPHMALHTGNSKMGPCQNERRFGMIKCCWLPGGGRVT
jgi:hypothetical protein